MGTEETMPFTVLFAHDQFLYDDTLEDIYKDLILAFPDHDAFQFKNCSYRHCLAIAVREQVDAIAVIAFDDSEGTIKLFEMLHDCPLTRNIPSLYLSYKNQIESEQTEMRPIADQEPPPLPYFRAKG